MTAELTFTPGRVPGIGKSVTRGALARRGLPHAAAPRSLAAAGAQVNRPKAVAAPEDLAPGMTLAQRRALAALIHVPVADADARESALRGGAMAAWIAVLACAFAWTLAIVAELAPQSTAAALHVASPARTAMPHVTEGRTVA